MFSLRRPACALLVAASTTLAFATSCGGEPDTGRTDDRVPSGVRDGAVKASGSEEALTPETLSEAVRLHFTQACNRRGRAAPCALAMEKRSVRQQVGNALNGEGDDCSGALTVILCSKVVEPEWLDRLHALATSGDLREYSLSVDAGEAFAIGSVDRDRVLDMIREGLEGEDRTRASVSAIAVAGLRPDEIDELADVLEECLLRADRRSRALIQGFQGVDAWRPWLLRAYDQLSRSEDPAWRRAVAIQLANAPPEFEAPARVVLLRLAEDPSSDVVARAQAALKKLGTVGTPRDSGD